MMALTARNHAMALRLSYLDERLPCQFQRGLDGLGAVPKRKSVIQFILNDSPNETANYWLVAKPGEETDLCYTDPKFDVDLYIVCNLRALTSAWMGHSTFETEIDGGRISLTGHDLMVRTLTKWLMRSRFADVAKSTLTENVDPSVHTSVG